MSDLSANGHRGRIEPPNLREAHLLQDVQSLGRILIALALGCELVLDLNDAPCGEEEG